MIPGWRIQAEKPEAQKRGLAAPLPREKGTGYCAPNPAHCNLAGHICVGAAACPLFAACRALILAPSPSFSSSRVSASGDMALNGLAAMPYSTRSVTAGSTLVTRRAGM